MLNKSNDDEVAKARLEQVLEAIKNQDKEALKSMFSEHALEEADDFDGNIDSLLEFFQGEVVSWQTDVGPVYESNNYGHKTKEIYSAHSVTTDKQEYYILLRDYPVDTDHPDNVGLYLLLVVKADDRLKIYDGEQKILYDGDQDIPRSGIYLPTK